MLTHYTFHEDYRMFQCACKVIEEVRVNTCSSVNNASTFNGQC